jgi:outer membrane receptor protein involved in Fe transport
MSLGFLNAQTTVSGTITSDSGEPLIGANLLVKGTISGTITDIDGKFTLTTAKVPPFTLQISYTGFVNQDVEVSQDNQNLEIILKEAAETLGEVVVSAASRVDEKFIEAPVTIEKVDLQELRTTPTFDAYSSLNSLKGVQASTGSLTFTSVNTRGFADMQNWRFVQLIDGMDASAPGLNYPLGGASGPADIDIASIELVPGANSALYGANAFNGLLTINTKSPFFYQGVSAYVKGGVTVQDAGGTNPLTDIGFRYAKSFNDKFAFKINFGLLNATDWTANDESYYINGSRALAGNPDQFLSIPRNNPNFDAVNVYGDEVQAQVDLDGSGMTTAINRTGIKEEDIVDYDITSIKADASLHYRITDNIEASYGYRFIQSDAILRHTTIYPLVKFNTQFHRFELKGSNWNLKAFNSREDAKESYAMLVTGAFIEQGRKSNENWAADYGAAFRGEVSGVTGGSHDAARLHADRDMPAVDSDAFQALRTATLTNPNLATGGSQFIDHSNLFSVDGNYDITPIADILDVKIGANYRKFTLDSEGNLFNDGPTGFMEPIPVEEYGAYAQLGKKLLNDRLHLRGSLRYDKHQDFEGKVTPRISAVLGLDKNKLHNLRASYQTGFRNPSAQEGYINLDIGAAVLLGGIKNNVENLNFPGLGGATVPGLDLHKGLVTLASFGAFRATGDPSVLQPANLDFLVQEKNTTFEVGYKGIIANKLLVDLNYYNTTYEDLVVRITTVSPQAGRAFAVYTNIDDDVTSNGVGLGLNYLIGKGYKAGFNYTYTSFDAEEATRNNPGFLPSFNTPENRFNISFSGSDIANSNIGFNLKLRSWDAYTWQSPFGAGAIDAKAIVDLAVTYKLKNLQSMIKLGASNLLNNGYKTVYGGPEVGSIYYISWTYDQMFSR